MRDSYTFFSERPMWRLESMAVPDGSVAADVSSEDPYAAARRGDGDNCIEQEYIVVGDEAVFVTDIAGYRLEGVVERDLNGLIAAAGLTLNLAALFLVGVVAFEWRTQFLIAVVLFFVLGIGSLLELFKTGRSQFQKLTFYVEGAEPIEFCCADDQHVQELVQNLNVRGIGAI